MGYPAVDKIWGIPRTEISSPAGSCSSIFKGRAERRHHERAVLAVFLCLKPFGNRGRRPPVPKLSGCNVSGGRVAGSWVGKPASRWVAVARSSAGGLNITQLHNVRTTYRTLVVCSIMIIFPLTQSKL